MSYVERITGFIKPMFIKNTNPFYQIKGEEKMHNTANHRISHKAVFITTLILLFSIVFVFDAGGPPLLARGSRLRAQGNGQNNIVRRSLLPNSTNIIRASQQIYLLDFARRINLLASREYGPIFAFGNRLRSWKLEVGSGLEKDMLLTSNWRILRAISDWLLPTAYAEPNIFTDNIGIGTTGPANKLVIDSGALELSGTANVFYGSAEGLYRPAAGTLGLVAGGTGGLYQKNGTIGIGTTNPGTRLQVVSSNATEVAPFSIWNNSASANQLVTMQFLNNTNGELTGAIKSKLYASGLGGDLSFWTLATDGATSGQRMVIDATGLVGIGTTGPAYKLHVYADGPAIVAQDDTGPQTQIYSGDSNGRIGTYSNHPLGISVNNSDKMWINTTGLIGIGTTSPEAKLDVSAGTLRVGTAGDVNIAHDLYFEDSTASSIKSYGPLTIQSGNPNSNYNLTLKGTGTGKVYIDDDLEITGTTTFPSGLTVSSGNITASSGNVSATSGTGTFGNLQISANTLSATNNSGVAIYDNASGGIFVEDGGEVGIGTTGPGAKLHVRTGSSGQTFSNNDGLLIENDGAVNNSYYAFQIATAGLGKMFSITNAGNVGIGTTGPGKKLDVKGSGDTGININNGNAGSLAGIYLQDNSADQWGIAINSEVSGNNLEFRRLGGSGNVIISSGYVGIGTTTPSYKLQISGGSTAPTVFQIDNSATTYGSEIRIVNTGTSGRDWRIGSAQASNTAGVGKFFIFDGTAGATGVLDRLVIDSTGNVGIGTTGPTEKLQIGDGTGNNYLLLTMAGGTGISGIKFRPALVTTFGFDIVHQDNSGLNFIRHNNDAAGVSAMYIDRANGNVGIGTAGPGQLLTVEGGQIYGHSSTALKAMVLTGSDSATSGVVASLYSSSGRPAVIHYSDAANYNLAAGAETDGTFGIWTGRYAGVAGTKQLAVSGTGATVTGVLTVSGTGNSSIAGNVGIGTTAPGTKLDVTGTVRATGVTSPSSGTGVELLYDSSNATNPGFLFAYDRSGTYKGLGIAGYTLNFYTNSSGEGTQKMVITSGGNVGIATTNPAYKLDVTGDIRSTGTIIGNLAQGTVTPSGFTQGSVIFAGSGGTLSQDNATLYWNDTDNRLGIGTTGPAYPLHLYSRNSSLSGSMYRAVGIGNDAENGTILVIGRSADTGGWNGIQSITTQQHDYGNLILNADGGNVGIGTTAPGKRLDVSGDIRAFGGSRTIGVAQADGDYTAKLYESGADGYLELFTGESTPASRIKLNSYGNSYINPTSGNVGIGTAGPGYKLEVAGTLGVTGATVFNGDMSITKTNPSINFYHGSPNDYSIQNEAGTFKFKDNGGISRFEVTQAGNVQMDGTLLVDGTGNSYINGNMGIGTISPAGDLHIERSSGDPDIKFTDVSQGSFMVGMPDGTNSFEIAEGNALGTNSRLRIINGGNVGIGTTAPGTDLVVANPNGTDDTRIQILSGTYYFDLLNQGSDGNAILESDLDQKMIFRTRNGSGTGDRMAIDKDGYVGIGTTAPATTLTLDVPNVATGSGWGNLVIRSTDSYAVDKGGSLVFAAKYSSAGASADIAGVYGRKENSTDGNYSGYLQFGTRLNGAAIAEVMRITSGGNVGIGTTLPAYKLDVTGDIRSTGTIIGNLAQGTVTPSGFTQGSVIFAGSGGTLSQDNPNFYWNDTDNRLGIGTTAPAYKLDVYGTGTNNINTQFQYAGEVGIRLNNTLANTWDITNDSNLKFIRGGSEKVRIDSSGYVGIGTTGPADSQGFGKALDIQSSSYGSGVYLRDSDDTTIYGYLGYDSSGLITTLGSYGANTQLRFNTGTGAGTEKVRITTAGNFGIGTTGPVEMLHLKGDDKELRIDSADYQLVSLGNIGGGSNLDVGGLGLFDHGVMNVWLQPTLNDYSSYIGSKLAVGAVGSTSAGTAQLYVNGNVGIGTTGPGAKLDVRGDMVLGAGTSEKIYGGAGLSYIELYNSSTGDMTFYGTYGTGDINFNTASNATPKMKIQYDGNVGIGTTGPSGKLDISGGYLNIINAESSVGAWRLGAVNGVVGSYSTGVTAMRADGGLKFTGRAVDVSASPDMMISTAGSVGIGTTAPSAKLEVAGSLQVSTAGDTGIAHDLVLTNIDSSNINSYGPLTIQSGGSNDNFNLTLKGTGTGKVYIDDDLEITGTTTFPSGLTVSSGNITASSGNVSATSGTGTFGNLQISGNTLSATNNSGVAIYDNASGGIFVEDGGEVGIGTAAPQRALHVSGNNSSSAPPEFELSNTSMAAGAKNFNIWGDSTSATWQIRTLTDNSASLQTLFMALQPSTGNVGIGTTSPGAKLNIYDSASTGRDIRFLGGSSGHVAEFIDGTGYTTATANVFIQDADNNAARASLQIKGNNGAIESLWVGSTGNVGIGTTNPGNKLHINGGKLIVQSNSGSYGQIQLANPDVGESTLVMAAGVTGGYGGTLTSSDNDYIWAFGPGSYSTTPDKFNIGSNGITGNVALSVNSPSGNVGIGTTAPGAKLTVDGATGVLVHDGTYTEYGATVAYNQSGTTNTYLYNSYTGSTASAIKLGFGTSLGSGVVATFQQNGNIGIGTTGPLGKLHIKDGNTYFVFKDSASTGGYTTTFSQDDTGLKIGHNTSNRDIEFQTNSDTKMTILAGGSVGIGTADPGAKLDVVGGAVRTNNQLISTVATGTAPLAVSSTTAVTNLNADLLDGSHASAFAASGHAHTVVGDKGLQNAESGRNLIDNGIYTYTTYSGGTGGPTTYNRILSWGNSGSAIQLSGDWISLTSTDLRVRSLRDCCQDWSSWTKVWTEGTDGSASGLDADLLDGISSASFAQLGSSASFTGSVTASSGFLYPDSPSQMILSQGTNWGIYWNTADTGAYQNSYEFSGGGTTRHALELGTGNAYFAIGSGYVGIGTTGPGGKLVVSSSNGPGDGTGDLVLQNPAAYSDGVARTLAISFKANNPTPDIQYESASIRAVLTPNAGYTIPQSYLGFFTKDNTANGGALTEQMRITSTGNVGIGTTGPVVTSLQVKGAYNGDNANIRLDSTGSESSGISFYGATGNVAARNWQISNNHTTWGALEFLRSTTNTGAPTTNVLLFDTNGNVGIGTTGPAAKLDVQGNIAVNGSVNASGYFYGTNTGVTELLMNSAGTDWGTIQNDAGNTWSLGHKNNSTTALGTPVLTWTANNNVGIGTTTPYSRLSIKQSAETYVGGLHLVESGTADTYSWAVGTDEALYLGYANNASGADAAGDFTDRLTIQADGDVIMNNGNVGIGTTNPLASLDVAGTGIRLGGVTRTSWPTSSQWTTSGNDIYYTTGLVGIGTATIGAKLHVMTGYGRNAAALVMNSNNSSFGGDYAPLALVNTDTTVNSWSGIYYMDSVSDSIAGGIGLQFSDHTNDYGDLAFFTRGATNFGERMRIKSDGNVGIGTTGPGQKLEVAGSISLWGVSAAQRGLISSESGTNYLTIMGGYNDNGGVKLQTVTGGVTTDRVTITNGGSVGIGTTNPTAKLYVNGSAYAAGATLGGNLNLNWAASRDLYIDEALNGNLGGDLRIQAGNGEDAATESTSGGNLYIDGGKSYNTGVASVGNIYIGSRYASPVVIGSTGTTGAMVSITELTNSLLTLYNTSTAANNNRADIGFWNKRTTSGATNVATVSGLITDITQSAYKGALAFSTANNTTPAERMRIDYQGNVGIGTTGPGAKLHILDSSNAQLMLEEGVGGNRLSLHQTSLWNSKLMGGAYYNGTNDVYAYTGRGAANINLQHDSDNPGQYISFSTAAQGTAGNTITWSEKVRIDSSGNVGIGTTNPGALLDVGTSAAASWLRLNGASDSGLRIGAGTSGNIIQRVSADGHLKISSENGNIEMSGNVGIGTTGPASRLHIHDSGVGTLLVSGASGSDYVDAEILLRADSGANYRGAGIFMLDNTQGTEWYTGRQYAGSTSYIFAYGSGHDRALAQLGSSTKMMIKSNGYVGIGTTNPSSFLLQVAGHTGPNVDNTYDLGSTSIKWRDVYCNRGAFNGSDMRLKTNITDTNLGLDFILSLRPVQYNWIKEDDGRHQGVLAQDIEKLVKEKGIEFAGLRHDQQSDSYALSYTEFIAPLIKAVQEQQKEIEELKRELAEVKQRR